MMSSDVGPRLLNLLDALEFLTSNATIKLKQSKELTNDEFVKLGLVHTQLNRLSCTIKEYTKEFCEHFYARHERMLKALYADRETCQRIRAHILSYSDGCLKEENTSHAALKALDTISQTIVNTYDVQIANNIQVKLVYNEHETIINISMRTLENMVFEGNAVYMEMLETDVEKYLTSKMEEYNGERLAYYFIVNETYVLISSTAINTLISVRRNMNGNAVHIKAISIDAKITHECNTILSETYEFIYLATINNCDILETFFEAENTWKTLKYINTEMKDIDEKSLDNREDCYKKVSHWLSAFYVFYNRITDKESKRCCSINHITYFTKVHPFYQNADTLIQLRKYNACNKFCLLHSDNATYEDTDMSDVNNMNRYFTLQQSQKYIVYLLQWLYTHQPT